MSRGRTKACIRCSAPASTTWSICADGNKPRPVCTPCDVELNEMVMRWAFGDRRESDLSAYRQDKLGMVGHG